MIDQNLLEQVADHLEKLQPYSPDNLAIDLERIRLQALADQVGVEIDPWQYADDEIREHLIRQRRRENLRKARYLLTGAWGPEEAASGQRM